MARIVRVTLLAVALAVATSVASAEQVRNAHVASRTNFRAQQNDPYASSQPSEVTTAAPYSSQPAATTTAAPYSSQPAEITTAAPYSSQPTTTATSAPYTTTAAPYSSQPAEVTTAAPYAASTTAAPYSSQPAEITTAAPYTTTAAPYSSQPAEVTTQAPYAASTTAAPYSSQPAEITTAAPYASTTAAPYSSQPAEVTTQAPYGSQPAEVTTQAPAMAGSGSGVCQWVYIDAQFVLSGAGWTNVQANSNAWASLSGAVTSDLASLLGRTQADISIKSITAAKNALTIVFTARSDALAEAARIAALIRDDVPASAPLPATDNVYASVGSQSAQDVSVTSHTGTSRDMYDCTGTPAPSQSSSSNANEVTTQAPAGAASTSGSYAPTTSGSYGPSSAPSGSYTPAPSPSSYPVYSSLVLSGNGWQQIAASAWNALKAALASDIAAALNMSSGSITINVMQATSTGLRVNYTVMTPSEQAAGSVSVQTSELDSSLPLPATSVLYQQANPSMKNATVAVAWSGSSSHNFYSPAGTMMSWMPLVASAAAVAAVAALVQ